MYTSKGKRPCIDQAQTVSVSFKKGILTISITIGRKHVNVGSKFTKS
jgi:hypothetical protein